MGNTVALLSPLTTASKPTPLDMRLLQLPSKLTAQHMFGRRPALLGARWNILWPTMASSIDPAEIEVETFLARQPDLDSIAPHASPSREGWSPHAPLRRWRVRRAHLAQHRQEGQFLRLPLTFPTKQTGGARSATLTRGKPVGSRAASQAACVRVAGFRICR
jgi:hypothetical protein